MGGLHNIAAFSRWLEDRVNDASLGEMPELDSDVWSNSGMAWLSRLACGMHSWKLKISATTVQPTQHRSDMARYMVHSASCDQEYASRASRVLDHSWFNNFFFGLNACIGLVVAGPAGPALTPLLECNPIVVWKFQNYGVIFCSNIGFVYICGI